MNCRKRTAEKELQKKNSERTQKERRKELRRRTAEGEGNKGKHTHTHDSVVRICGLEQIPEPHRTQLNKATAKIYLKEFNTIDDQFEIYRLDAESRKFKILH